MPNKVIDIASEFCAIHYDNNNSYVIFILNPGIIPYCYKNI